MKHRAATRATAKRHQHRRCNNAWWHKQACIGCHLLLAMHPSTLRGQVLHTRTQPAIITATRAPLHQEHHAVKHFAWTLSLLQWFYLLCLPLCIGTQQPTVFILGDTHNRNTRPRSFDWKIESALLPKFRCGTKHYGVAVVSAVRARSAKENFPVKLAKAAKVRPQNEP